jgi:DNA-binding LacI/PurR family transcriptional regulator
MISSLDLAKMCGVSQGTVDRALHDRPGISAETKRRILEEAARHGYQAHPAAAEMLKGKSDTVAAVISKLNSIFFMDMLSSIQTKITAAGFRFIICPVSNTAELFDALKEFAARRYTAAIMIPSDEKIVVPRQITENIKVLSLLSPCSNKNITFVSPDEEKTGRTAVEYLCSRGHKKVVHFTYSRKYYAVAAREAGYRKAMLEYRLRPAVLENSSKAGLSELIREDGYSAVFCHNDWLALQAVRELGDAGMRIAEDVSVLGVDNSPTFAELYPGMTTLQYPFEWLAETVAAVISDTGPVRSPPAFKVINGNTVGSQKR